MSQKRQYCDKCHHRMTVYAINAGSDIDLHIQSIALCHNPHCEAYTPLCDHGQPWFLCYQCQQQRIIDDTTEFPF